MPLLYAVVASGFQISGDIDLRQQALMGIQVPTVTSGPMLIQGNFDTTSANFMRLNDDLGDIQYATGPGSKYLLWPQGFVHPSYLRIEAGVAQTAPRTFTLITRPL